MPKINELIDWISMVKENLFPIPGKKIAERLDILNNSSFSLITYNKYVQVLDKKK